MALARPVDAELTDFWRAVKGEVAWRRDKAQPPQRGDPRRVELVAEHHIDTARDQELERARRHTSGVRGGSQTVSDLSDRQSPKSCVWSASRKIMANDVHPA